MLISKRKAIIMCILVIMISVVVQFLKNKLSCPSSHHLSLFLESVILLCDVFIT